MTTPPTGDRWRSLLAVRLAALMAGGLGEEAALVQALAEQAAHHARTCCEDCWLADDEGLLRCGVCGQTAPPELQPAHDVTTRADHKNRRK
jgi:hypothetical protein